MYAYDVDGDGDNDVITSLAAHDFGLAWYEQVHDGGKTVFQAAPHHGRQARRRTATAWSSASCTRSPWPTSTATG